MARAVAPPVEPVPETALLALAQKKFGTLSRAEEALFRAAQAGTSASMRAKDEKENDPANAANWPADRAVRAACIAWICTDPQASALVTYRGLAFYWMRIDGELDLSDVEIKFPLLAKKCAFSDNISFQDAQMRGFYFLECKIKGLKGDRAIINGSLFLQGLKAEGEISLVRATIGGNLDCVDSQFSNPKAVAFAADSAQIQGSVFFRDSFKAEGEVNLVGAIIGRNLACSGGQFSNAKGFALIGNGAKINDNIFLRNVKAEGEVNFVGATIGGDLDCSGGQFSRPGGTALVVESTKVGRNVLFRRGFRAQGEVSLMRATIGTLLIQGVLEADQTILDLRLTQVETFWDDEASWPKAGNLFLDGFRYDRLYETAPFQSTSRKKWLDLQPRDRFRPQPYEQLAAVLRQMGHERDARQVMIEKNRERARFTHFPQQGWWWYNVFGRFIGYGYAPWRAFAMSVAMISLGTFLFYLGSTHGLIWPTSENAYAKEPNRQLIVENARKRISDTYPVFNAFVYSLESFVPLLKLDQSANWRPNANRGAVIPLLRFWAPRSGELLRYYLYLHIASGWLLTSLWVGAITGLVKT